MPINSLRAWLGATFGLLPSFALFLIIITIAHVEPGHVHLYVGPLFLFFMLTQPVCLVLAYGIWKEKVWAYWLAAVIAIFGIFVGIIGLYDAFLVSRFDFYHHGHQLFTIPISTLSIVAFPIILYYLMKSH